MNITKYLPFTLNEAIPLDYLAKVLQLDLFSTLEHMGLIVKESLRDIQSKIVWLQRKMEEKFWTKS